MSGGKLSPNTKLLNNPYGYNGEYHDLESGFQYLRARYYNPETARFITRDSYLGEINEPLTLNRYAYTSNNPVMKIDPSGNWEDYAGDYENTHKPPTSTSSSTATKAASSRPVVGWGSRGEAVKTLQTMLKTLNYYIGKSGVDGIFGDDTDAAVRAFQRDNGLKVDGIVGINTWTKLEEIYNNVIGTGIIPDNVSQGSNGSGGNSGSFVNSKVVDAGGSSNNSNACDDLGGGVASSEGIKQALKKYSNIKDPAQRVYVAWNATSPEERLQLLKIDSRAYAGEQFVSRLSYLQYRKGIDVTNLSLNELDKIYEEVHYTRVNTTMDYLNIAGVIASSSKKAGEGIAELLKKIKGSGEAKYTYNMIENPGPLAKLNPSAAATFESGKYNLIKLKEDTILYRGGQAGGGKNAFGQFFTRTAPESSAIVRIDSAVKPQWIDPKTGALTASSPIESVYAIKIPKGTTIYEGPAGYQSGIYIGGKEQIFISKPWEIPGVKIISETKLPK